MGDQRAGQIDDMGCICPRKTENHRMVRLEELRGEPYYIAYNTKSFRYIRLDESYYGAFNRMDGTKSIRTIIEDSFDESNRPDTQTIEEFIKLLLQTDMILPLGLESPADVEQIERGTGAKGSIKKLANIVFLSRISFRNIDNFITRLHRILDKDAVKWPIAAFAVMSYGTAFLSVISDPIHLSQQFKIFSKPFLFSPISLAVIFLSVVISAFLHEIAHAVTCKHFGCRIHNMGIKIYLGIPGLFTDTTDACTLTKWKRVAIDAAGSVINIFLGISLIGISVHLDDAAATILFVVGAMNLITACYNLIPFVEYDGYFIASDIMEVPNLRMTALRLALNKQHWRNMVRENRIIGIDGIIAAYGLCLIAFRLIVAVILILAIGLFICRAPHSEFRIAIVIGLLTLFVLRMMAAMKNRRIKGKANID